MSANFEPTIGVYGLVDPNTGRLMYIGQSTDIEYRYRQHCSSYSSDPNPKKQEWVSALHRIGVEPVLRIIERCGSSDNLDEVERKWIRDCKARGEAEFNISVGGSARTASAILNTPREEWFQFARKIKEARSALVGVGDDAGRMVSAKHLDAIVRLVRKLDREVNLIEKNVRKRFPEWEDVSQALWATQDPAL